ncbi:serine/arginine-rich splicing factor 4-like [Haliotis asinina]|uniref:serine/arginine-rich splicing factor 4-like n=1 Tax=Haliotis asinina TaxID=109174 RepID=UPI0035320577
MKFIPKFDKTDPDSIQKFLLWSHIMMERLEEANIKLRRRLKADDGEGDIAEGDDDEDPEEMLQLSSNEATGGGKSTAVKGTFSQAQEDMKARAQTIAQKVVADYRSTNRYTKGTAVSVISNKGHAGKGVGKQRMLDRKVLGQLFHKSTNMIRSQSKRANVGADLVQQGITWVKQHIRRMLEQNKMIKSETDEESKKASFSAKSDDRSFQQRTDKGERSKKGRRGNSDRSRKDHQQRTENRGQANEDLQRRTGNGDRSRKECQQRTGNYDHSRDKYQHRREKRGQSSEDLQLWTDNSSRSRKEFPDLKMVKEEPVEVYMDEYVNEDEEYALAYVDEDGVHVMDDGFVMGEGGHVEREVRMDEEPDDVYHGMYQGSRGDSIRSNQDVRGYRGEARSGLRNMDDPNMQMHDAEEDEYFDLGKGSFVEESEGFIHSERVVEVVNYDEHEGTFDTAWSESAEQDSRILPGQESSFGRVGRRLDRDRRLSNQRDSFETNKSVTRRSQGQGSRAHSESSSEDKSVKWRGKERNRGRETPEHTEHFRKDHSVKRDQKDFVDGGSTKSQKKRSKQIDSRDYHRNMKNQSSRDKSSSSKTKCQYLKKEGLNSKTKDQISSGKKNERKGGDNTARKEGNTFECELDDINEGALSGDGSLCEFDMDDIDMSDFVVMDEV